MLEMTKRGKNLVCLLTLMIIIAIILTIAIFLKPAPPVMFLVDNPQPQSDALFGCSITGIGDISGDGIGDIAIGAKGADKVYLLSGDDQSVVRILSNPEGTTGRNFGWAVFGVGDVNGDGIPDIAVGAPGNPELIPVPETSDCGRVIIFCGATGNVIYYLHPASEFLMFGASLASLGDINGDGIGDIAVGAPSWRGNSWGKIFAFSGLDGTQLWETWEPGYPSQRQVWASFGYTMASLDDVTGDGFEDLLVTAHTHGESLEGEAYVIDGSNGRIFRTHNDPVPNEFFGVAPGVLGDQNRDNSVDYAFSDPIDSCIYLYNGANGGLISSIPDRDNTRFGIRIVGVEDRDGDGINDFWVSAPAGRVVYLLNNFGNVLVHVEDPTESISSVENGFGSTLTTIDDLDGDGLKELLIGKPGETINGYRNAGRVFLVLSKPSNPLYLPFKVFPREQVPPL
jgi:hypothetical protein